MEGSLGSLREPKEVLEESFFMGPLQDSLRL